MLSERADRRLFFAASCLLGVVFIAAQIVRSVEPLGLDQGLFACFGQRIPEGALPYRDLFDSKPPLFLYLYSIAFALPGQGAEPLWWFEGIWLAATMGVTFAIARRAWGRWAGLAAATLLFVGMWAPGWGGYWSRGQAEELLALPVLAAAWAARSAGERTRAALWAGVWTGIAGLIKIPAMAVAGAWVVTWLIDGKGHAARRVGWMALGLIIPWSLAIAWFALHGALGELWEGIVQYQLAFASTVDRPWGETLLMVNRNFVRELPATWLLTIVGLATSLSARGSSEAKWLGPWLVFALAAIVSQRQLAGYHHILLVPALAMAGAYGMVVVMRAWSRGGTPRWFAIGCGAIVLALGARGVVRWTEGYEADAAYRFGSITRSAYLRRFPPGPFSPALQEEVAGYVRARTDSSQRVLVWGLSPGIYALADRRPATRFAFHQLLLTESPLSRRLDGLAKRRAELLDGLRRDPPEYILVATNDASFFEPQDSYEEMIAFPELHRLVESEYELETRIGLFLVYRRLLKN